MRRRHFIGLLGAAAAWPLLVRAQQPLRRLGVLFGLAENNREAQAWLATLRDELARLGWTEGRNIEIKFRASSDVEMLKSFAKELVGLQPDLIVTGTTPAGAAILQQTRTIPVVFALVADPVGSGFIATLSHPGGNATVLPQSLVHSVENGLSCSRKSRRA
jgi:putative ABC transport system substrate-binding protein